MIVVVAGVVVNGAAVVIDEVKGHGGGGCYDFKQLSQLLTVVSSKVQDHTEPRRVQVLDLYCLTRFESENSSREDCLLKTS